MRSRNEPIAEVPDPRFSGQRRTGILLSRRSTSYAISVRDSLPTALSHIWTAL